MKPHHFFALVTAIFLIALGACRDTTLSPADSAPQDSISTQPGDSLPLQNLDTSVIKPLVIGNQWMYRHQVLDSAFNITDTRYDTSEIVGTQFIHDQWWYRDNWEQLQVNRSDGYWERAGVQNPDETLWLKYPIEVGDSWVRFDRMPVLNSPNLFVREVVKLIGKDIEVTVPAGTFRAIRYQVDTYNLDGTSYQEEVQFIDCVPGIGAIKLEVYRILSSSDRYLWIRTELMDVVLK